MWFSVSLRISASLLPQLCEFGRFSVQSQVLKIAFKIDLLNFGQWILQLGGIKKYVRDRSD